jgi:lysophospholipid acyltransferase (LPLAT)-like uncharacterized protein
MSNDVSWMMKAGGAITSAFVQQAIKSLDIKIAYYDQSVDPSRSTYNQHCIFVFWHEYIALAVPKWAKCPVTMLVSQHRDAEWLTQAAQRMGFNIVRGSTTRGGSSAIRQLKRNSQFSSFGITPDGPTGPRREMAMGPIFLASLLRMPIVVTGFGYDRPWRLDTWDKFAIPRPFSRARVVMSSKIDIPPRLKRDEMEKYRMQIQVLINDMTSLAEDWARHGYRIRGEQRLIRECNSNRIVFPKCELFNQQIITNPAEISAA